MDDQKKKLKLDHETEMKLKKEQWEREEAERVAKRDQDQVKANHMKLINEAFQRLKTQQQARAREVLRELFVRGVKHIGKDKIQ